MRWFQREEGGKGVELGSWVLVPQAVIDFPHGSSQKTPKKLYWCRCHALVLRPPCLLKGLIPLIESGCRAFVATQGAPPLQRVLAENMESVLEPGPSGKPLPCMLLVGPEGDFTEEEMQELLAAGAKPVGLGPNRLRVETAAIAMVAGAVLQSDSLSFETEKLKEEPIAA